MSLGVYVLIDPTWYRNTQVELPVEIWYKLKLFSIEDNWRRVRIDAQIRKAAVTPMLLFLFPQVHGAHKNAICAR